MKRIIGFLGIALISGLLFSGGNPEAKKLDTAGKYHAAFGVETDYKDSVHRDAYFEKKYKNRADRNQLIIGKSGTVGYRILEGTFKDTVIKGNGTYEVSVTNANFNQNRSFRKLYVATDIPYTKKIKFRNVTISMNGRLIRTYEKAVLDEGEHGNHYCVLLLIDTNDDRVRNAFARSSVPTSTQNEIKISFDVKGFVYNKGEQPPTPTPVPTPTPEITPTPEAVAENPAAASVQTVTAEAEEVIKEVPIENKIGIGVTVVLAIGMIVLCVIMVNRRQH